MEIQLVVWIWNSVNSTSATESVEKIEKNISSFKIDIKKQ